MVMGDLVLLETEINPVMSKLIENGLEITAIHNHVLRGNPATFYMHVGGHGDPVRWRLRSCRRLQRARRRSTPPAAARTAARDRSRHRAARPDHRRQGPGQRRRLSVRRPAARSGHGRRHGASLTPPGPMGVATAINFQPTGGGKAAITGDFVLTGDEVNPVIRALRGNGIEVTAIHSHMLTEQPRLIFMHFWANDDAMKLAKGLRAALDKTASTSR